MLPEEQSKDHITVVAAAVVVVVVVVIVVVVVVVVVVAVIVVVVVVVVVVVGGGGGGGGGGGRAVVNSHSSKGNYSNLLTQFLEAFVYPFTNAVAHIIRFMYIKRLNQKKDKCQSQTDVVSFSCICIYCMYTSRLVITSVLVPSEYLFFYKLRWCV